MQTGLNAMSKIKNRLYRKALKAMERESLLSKIKRKLDRVVLILIGR